MINNPGFNGHSPDQHGINALFDPIAIQALAHPNQDQIGQAAQDIVQETGVSPVSNQPEEGGLTGDRLYKMFLAWDQSKVDEMKLALQCDAYYHGKQWTEKQMATHKARAQPTIWHQHTARQVNTMIGTEQRLRRDPKAYPRTPKHQTSSDAVTSALRFVNDEVNSPRQFSAATRDLFVRGIGVLYEGASLDAEANVELDKKWCDSKWFFYDPCSVMHDFSDAKYLGITRWLDEDEASAMMLKAGNPGAAERVAEIVGGYGDAGVSFHNQWGSKYGKSQNQNAWVDPDRRRVRLIEIWYRHDGTWRVAYCVENVKLHDQETPFATPKGVPRHPWNALSCYIDEDGMRYGVVKDMIPVQNEINYLHSKITWALSVRQVLWKKGQVGDIAKFKRELAKADGAPEYKGDEPPEVLQMNDQIQGLRELEGQAVAHLQNLGPNASLVGQGEGIENQSGRAIMARQNAGMTEMSPVYERIRDWKLQSYRNDWAIIKQFWRSEKWLRVLDSEDGMEFVGFNYPQINPQTGQPEIVNDVSQLTMDIIIEEGPDVVTMQEEMFNRLAELGNAIPPELLIELSAIPNKEKFLKILQESKAPPPEMMEMENRIKQLEILLRATEVDKNIASVEKDRADAAHRLMETAMMPMEMQNQQLQNSMSMIPGSQGAPMIPQGPQAGGGMPAPMPMILQQFPFQYGQPTFVDQTMQQFGGGAPNPPPGGPQGGQSLPPGAASVATMQAGPAPISTVPGNGPPPNFDLSQFGQQPLNSPLMG